MVITDIKINKNNDNAVRKGKWNMIKCELNIDTKIKNTHQIRYKCEVKKWETELIIVRKYTKLKGQNIYIYAELILKERG